MRYKLDSCPACGLCNCFADMAFLDRDFYVRCPDCGMRGPNFNDINLAIIAWNELPRHDGKRIEANVRAETERLKRRNKVLGGALADMAKFIGTRIGFCACDFVGSELDIDAADLPCDFDSDMEKCSWVCWEEAFLLNSEKQFKEIEEAVEDEND